MREIKFRAWTGRKMVDRNVLKNFKTVNLSNILGWLHKDYIPMQYTGLKDKNGKEIYEGDIVGLGTYTAQVLYDDFGCPCFMGLGYYEGQVKDFADCGCEGLFNKIEIIGNIHENQELL